MDDIKVIIVSHVILNQTFYSQNLVPLALFDLLLPLQPPVPAGGFLLIIIVVYWRLENWVVISDC
jgi:hypothetical protein